MSIIDAAWRQSEIPDADPEPFDPDATTRCEACGRDTDHEDVHLTPQGSLVCRGCRFRGYQLPPLEVAS